METKQSIIYELWEMLVTNGLAREEEISLVCAINGPSEKTMLDILYATTGYRTIEQAWESGKYFMNNFILDYYEIEDR